MARIVEFVLLWFPLLCLATDYGLIITNEMYPCNGENPPEKYVDISRFEIHENSDYETILNGSIIFKENAGSPLKFQYQLYQKERGKWVNAGFYGSLDNFCEKYFDQAEVWYNLTKTFEGNARNCPFMAGTEFKFNSFKQSSVLRNVPKKLNEDYRFYMNFAIENNENFCFMLQLKCYPLK